MKDMDTINIVGLPPDRIFEVYLGVREYFESFAERSRGETTAAQLAFDVAQGKQQCWIINIDGIRGCALTRFDGKVVEITHCSGSAREEWQDALVSEIEAWAKHVKAFRVRTINRPGWTPFLKTRGYRETHRIMERDIGQDHKDNAE